MLIHSKELLMGGSGNKQVYLNILTAPKNTLGRSKAEVAWVSRKPETTPPSNTPLLQSTLSDLGVNNPDREIVSLSEKNTLKTKSLTLNYVGQTTRTGYVFDVYSSGAGGTFGYVLQGSQEGESFFPAYCDNLVNYTIYGIVQGTTLTTHNASGQWIYTFNNVFNGATVQSYPVTYKE